MGAIFYDLAHIGKPINDDVKDVNPWVHLPILSLWLNYPHSEVPVVEFSDYFPIRGWDMTSLMTGQLRSAHPENVTKSDEECGFYAISALQSWLTLGLLEALFAERVTSQKFTVPFAQAKISYLTRLDPHFRIYQIVLSKGEPRYFDIQSLVSNVVALGFRMNTDSEFRKTNPPNHHAQMRSAFKEMERALRSPVFNPRCKLKPDNRTIRHMISFCGVFPTILAEIAYQELLTNTIPKIKFHAPESFKAHQMAHLVVRNWCPYTVTKLLETTNYSVFHWLWASGIEGLSSKSHSRCTENQCTAYHAHNPDNYETQHRTECGGNCGLFWPPKVKIYEILLEGKIPLLSAIRNDDEKLGYIVSVIAFDSSLNSPRFTAFSHVLADGWGGCTEKPFPMCQTQFLIELCANLPHSEGSIAFWIDAICIPNNSSLHEKAISQLASIYKSADAVVVLEETLLQCSIQASPHVLLLRILTSPWIDRVWTLQEAVLARQLYFKFKETCCSLNLSTGNLESFYPLQSSLREESIDTIYRCFQSKLSNLNLSRHGLNIASVANELRWRDTSNPSDQLLAVCSLLDVDFNSIFEARGSENRMKTFLILVKTLPSNIIFMEVARLQHEGFRWAPVTFLSRDSLRLFTNMENHSVSCTPFGLLGNYTIFEPNDRETVQFNNSTRFTIAVNGLRRTDWFDICCDERPFSFPFTHIILLPNESPRSAIGTMVLAAAVLIEELDKKTHGAIQDAFGEVEIACSFQKRLHLSVFRPFSVRQNRTDSNSVEIHGQFKHCKLLLR